jgi:hypothetical protein
MTTTKRVTGAWKLIGVPVCSGCDDDQILNRREINAYWQAVDHAVAEMREEGFFTRGPMGGEPLEEPCPDGPHDCIVCGLDFRELGKEDPKFEIQTTETTYGLPDSKAEHIYEQFYCSETCCREDDESRWPIIEDIIQEIRPVRRHEAQRKTEGSR